MIDKTKYRARVRQGCRPISYRRSFITRVKGQDRQHAALYAGKRQLCSGDMLEEDAAIICAVFNEAVIRRTVSQLDLFAERKTGSILKALDEIYEAGGKVWDDIDDPDKYLKEMRGEEE